MPHTISVIIPVKNGADTLARCLAAVRQQTGVEIVQIVVLDSASTDNSVAIAKEYGAEVVPVAPADFNHGLTRNLGAAIATGNLIYFTVQDAAIAEPDMLHKMAAHFNDTLVQGVVGIQGIPERTDTNPALWFRRYTQPVIETRYYPNGSFAHLTEQQQFEQSNWDDVNAMYRKSALQQIPFRETNFSEDWLWANEALKAGMKIIRDPSLMVYHYHHLYFSYVLSTQYIVNYYFQVYFQQLPHFPSLFKPLMQRTYTLFAKRKLPITQKCYWVFHNGLALLANLLSVCIFRLLYALGKEKGIKQGYQLICKKVPQGTLRTVAE